MKGTTTNQYVSSPSKVIIVFDGHGFCNKQKTSLTYKHYFLCNIGDNVGSDNFNDFLKQLVKDKGTTDLSILPNNSDVNLEHYLFELTNYQKMYSCNLRKALALDTSDDYKLYELARSFKYENIDYKFKIQYTNFHPLTGCQLVYVRLENDLNIKLSSLEKLIFPIFAQDQTVLMESCGFPTDIFEVEAIGVWGACRELNEDL